MTRLFVMLLVALLPLVGALDLLAAESPRDLKWAQLIPRSANEPKAKTLRPFFGQRPAPAPHEPGAGASAVPEAKWMSQPFKQPAEPAAIVSEFDGQHVRIGGYVVPLDFEATNVTEFLLVPFVGACIHVPPPPANQIIYVKAKDGFKITDVFDPVYVTGKMSAKGAVTGLAEAGYTIEAEEVVLRAQ